MGPPEHHLLARQLLRQGKFQEVERHYRDILRDRPGWAPALFQLAMLMGETGRHAEAADLLSRAVASEPDNPLYHNHLGVALARSGDAVRAETCFKRAIELQVDYFEACNNLGNVLRTQNRQAEAIAAYQRALALKPDYAEAHFNLANALRDQGQVGPAIASYRRAIHFRPDLADAHNNLGNVLFDAGQPDQAIATLEGLIHLAPRFPKAYNNLGVVLMKLGRLDEAAARFRQAIALDGSYAAASRNLAIVLRERGETGSSENRLAVPLAGRGPLGGGPVSPSRNGAQYPSTTPPPGPARELLNLGVSLGKSGDLQGAAASLRKAIELDPNYAEAYFNLGVALSDLHEIDDAIAAYRRAIELRENYAEARHALAMVQLQRGCFEEGWPDYEYRWKLPSSPRPYQHRQPRWDGARLDGKAILLHAEQGLGDTIQFARYIPLVARQAGRVYLVCQPPLHRLFSQWPNVHLLTDLAQRLPSYDVHCAVTSLPLAFGTRLGTIPADVPYLKVDGKLGAEACRPGQAAGVSDDRATGQPKIDPTQDESRRLRVGLVWAGNPLHQNDRQRSIDLSCLSPLAQFTDRVAFYGLQKGPAARQSGYVPELKIVDLAEDLSDFHDTAAAIANLDLVISVDTSVAHLAGALGVRVWTLLAFASDWRWLLDRTDSPWYPTMRLFRQPTAGDWQQPITQVVSALKGLVG